MKAKLSQLIQEADIPVMNGQQFTCVYAIDTVGANVLADHLIANGVRLQSKQVTSDKASDENKRWIPVTERLPDTELEALRKSGDKYGGVAVLAVSPHIERVFEVLYRRTVDGRPVFYIYDSENDGHFTRVVTHWMPMPQLPGEEAAK